MSDRHIAVLGSGLLGGSIALAAQKAGLTARLWARRRETVRQAKSLGLDANETINEVIHHAEIIIFATPVGAMHDLAVEVIPNLSPGVIVTDVGSVKTLPHQKLGPLCAKHRVHFIGSHPMAGSEKSGIEAAHADLFQGASCIITNDEKAPREKVEILEAFWDALGCFHPQLMTAEGHDRVVARISHFPHAMAVLAAEIGLKYPGDARFAGNGFRDTSRVASGDPSMWAEIMMENSQALSDALRDAGDSLRELLVMLENSDKEGLRTYLAEIKTRRDAVG